MEKCFLKNHAHLCKLNSEENQLLRFVLLLFFATFKITPRMIKILYLHILQADSTENLNAFCKLIVLVNYKISKNSKKSVLRYIENITGSVGNLVKCIREPCDDLSSGFKFHMIIRKFVIE